MTLPTDSDLVAWTQRFVRYPSPQTDMFEAEPQVLGFIDDCVTPLVAELGLPHRKDGMGNLIVEIGPRNAERSVMLMAYAMTHPASSMTDPFAGELIEKADGPAVRGRGVSEQKGSLAAALAATVAAARSESFVGSLVFTVSTAGETGRHDAAISILDALGYAPNLGVVVIGTNGRVSLGNKGRIDVDVIVGGKATHSAMPWAGVNAIDGAREVLNQLAALKIDGGAHPGLGEATLVTNFIESGPRATHTIQNEVRITLDRRLLPGQRPETAFAEIQDALSLPEPWTLDIRQGAYMYPCAIAEDGPLMTSITEGCRAQDLAPPETFYSHGALDAGYLAEHGCESAMWGPGDQEYWHTDEELILVADLVRGAAAYRGFIEEAMW